jgi:hypothetical protein
MLVPVVAAGQRQEGRGVVEPDIAEDDDDRRDDERQERDELDHRTQAEAARSRTQ